MPTSKSDRSIRFCFTELFAPFAEFDLLSRDHKRQLNTITPEIVAANYEIHGVYLGGLMRSHTVAAFQEAERIYLRLDVAA